jgi:hypothetical protein
LEIYRNLESSLAGGCGIIYRGVKPPSESEKKKRKFESTKEYYKGYDKDKRARKYLPE